jgi:hypothetical protein
MAKYRTTPQITDGRFRAVLDLSDLITLDWTNITSDMFTSLKDGDALPSGLTFASFTIVADSGYPCYLKYRAADNVATDPIDMSSGVLPVVGAFSDAPLNLHKGPIKELSIKKSIADDTVFIVAGFDL